MAVYATMVLTKRGQDLYTKAQAGVTLNFTRMQIGSGDLGITDPATLVALITPISFFPIISVTAKENMAYVKGIFTNANLVNPTYSCEIGLFAQDPDLGEILYSYSNAGASGDNIPAIAAGPFAKQFTINAAISNTSTVTAIIPSNVYAPVTDPVFQGSVTLPGDPSLPLQAAPMRYVTSYVDSVKNGFMIKEACRLATTQNMSLNGSPTIDGIAVVSGDRILVKNQVFPRENGIWIAASGLWTRAPDCRDSSTMKSGIEVLVNTGTFGGGNTYYLSTPDPITVGTTSINFTLCGARDAWGSRNHNTRSYLKTSTLTSQNFPTNVMTKVKYGSPLTYSFPDNLSEWSGPVGSEMVCNYDGVVMVFFQLLISGTITGIITVYLVNAGGQAQNVLYQGTPVSGQNISGMSMCDVKAGNRLSIYLNPGNNANFQLVGGQPSGDLLMIANR